MKGKFITFEGLDGSGKTTAITKVVTLLQQRLGSDQFIHTREPGGNIISENIRKVILDQSSSNMDKKTEVLLYAAARRQHIVENILPSLKDGKFVLCDRFVDSSLAYQGMGRGINMKAVEMVNNFITEGLKPDLTFYFNLAPEEGLKRINSNRQNDKNRLDNEKLSFYYKVQEGYKQIIKNDPKRFIIIDASKSINEIVDDVIANILLKTFDRNVIIEERKI